MSEERAKSEPRESPKRETPRHPLKASPSLPSEDSQEEEESRESPHSSMTTPDKSSRDSSKALSETLSPTLNTPAEKPSLLWTSFTPSRDKAEPSMVSEVDNSIKIYLFYTSKHHNIKNKIVCLLDISLYFFGKELIKYNKGV